MKVMSSRWSKLVLVSHVSSSVGWLGAVGVFFALAVAGLKTLDNQLARSSYLAMEISTRYVIVPLCLASLVTGIIHALGTKWGLFKHYWISVKLFLTISATFFLLLHLKPIAYLANVATEESFSAVRDLEVRMEMISKSGLAIIVLLVTVTLSVFKPWGLIKYQRQNKERGQNSLSVYLIGILIIVLLIFVVVHLLKFNH